MHAGSSLQSKSFAAGSHPAQHLHWWMLGLHWTNLVFHQHCVPCTGRMLKILLLQVLLCADLPETVGSHPTWHFWSTPLALPILNFALNISYQWRPISLLELIRFIYRTCSKLSFYIQKINKKMNFHNFCLWFIHNKTYLLGRSCKTICLSEM